MIGGERKDLEILEVTYGTVKETGIDFLLLIDNSGSMYEKTRWGEARITQVKEALKLFFSSTDGSKDRVAMSAFNTYLQPLARLQR